jgi:Fibronectin type III domain
VSLTWTVSSGATSYRVKRATASNGAYTQVAAPTTNTYINTALTNGMTYYYVVSALNSTTESANSVPVSATPTAPAPTAPTGVTASAGNAQVILSWTASSGATSYNVKRSTSSTGSFTSVGTATTTSYTNTGLTNGTTYYYVVSAVNSTGESANSTQASGTPVNQTWPNGNPGCGLSAAAFCDTFDTVAPAPRGRSYELNSSRWSAARNVPRIGTALEIGRADVSNCRSDVPAIVYPPGDTRICDGNSGIQSNHLLTAAAGQYYGTNSYRIRQPFDFAGRTGKIVFDADATANMLLGWIAIAVTEDPMPSPSFSVYPGAGNFEGGVIPKNGLTIELAGLCQNASRVLMINEYRDHVDYLHDFPNIGDSTCFSVLRNRLNHFEVRLSQSKVELWATPYSADGVNFGTATLVASANLGLTFTRGYVQLVTHNHATTKYWAGEPSDAQNSWVARWDNVGFDGPVINNTREFEVPDALVPTSAGVNVGYLLNDALNLTKTSVTIRSVTAVAQATRARLAMNVEYFGNFSNIGLPTWALTYRLNGNAWRTYNLTAAEQALFSSGVALQGDKAGQANALIIGVLGHVFDVPLSDLVNGDNVLEIATSNVPFGGYPPRISNIDLILTNP